MMQPPLMTSLPGGGEGTRAVLSDHPGTMHRWWAGDRYGPCEVCGRGTRGVREAWAPGKHRTHPLCHRCWLLNEQIPLTLVAEQGRPVDRGRVA
jgi:hypothetical protein